jgi:hypothetical protein
VSATDEFDLLIGAGSTDLRGFNVLAFLVEWLIMVLGSSRASLRQRAVSPIFTISSTLASRHRRPSSSAQAPDDDRLRARRRAPLDRFRSRDDFDAAAARKLAVVRRVPAAGGTRGGGAGQMSSALGQRGDRRGRGSGGFRACDVVIVGSGAGARSWRRFGQPASA